MIPRSLFLLSLLTTASLLTPLPAEELDVLKDATEKWIDTRNRLAAEKSEWTVNKELLKGSIQTLTSTRNTLEENVRILTTRSQSLKENKETDSAKLELQESSQKTILDQVTVYESRIQSLAKRLPAPLKEELAPFIRKIPSLGHDDVPTANRLQNVVAISTLIDEFNNDLTLTHTIKTLDDGNAIEVRVLYWGLSGAYATNIDGSRAWVIRPGTPDWKWVPAEESSAAIRELFEVYDKTIDPVLISVPFAFSEKGGAE